MLMLLPTTITTAMLTASNVALTDEDEWLGATTYSIGDRVMVLSTTNKVYESRVNSNTANVPADSPTEWLELGAVNRWKAFDRKVLDKVSRADSITYEITLGAGQIINGVTFIGLEADTVQLQVFDADDLDNPVHDETQNAVGSTLVASWWDYAYAPFDLTSTVTFRTPSFIETPALPNDVIKITITRTGSTAKVGQIVLGFLIPLGATGEGTDLSMIDFSRKDRDAFGNATLLERDFAPEANYRVQYPTAGTQRIKNLLDDNRAKPVVWLVNDANDRIGTTIYGFLKRYRFRLSPVNSEVQISVEGFT